MEVALGMCFLNMEKIGTVLCDVPPPIHSPRRSYATLLREMCTLTLSIWLLQLEQVTVEWPEVGSQLSFRPAEMEMPSTFRSKLPLILLKGDKKKTWSNHFLPHCHSNVGFAITPTPGEETEFREGGSLPKVIQQLSERARIPN